MFNDRFCGHNLTCGHVLKRGELSSAHLLEGTRYSVAVLTSLIFMSCALHIHLEMPIEMFLLHSFLGKSHHHYFELPS